MSKCLNKYICPYIPVLIIYLHLWEFHVLRYNIHLQLGVLDGSYCGFQSVKKICQQVSIVGIKMVAYSQIEPGIFGSMSHAHPSKLCGMIRVTGLKIYSYVDRLTIHVSFYLC